MRPASSAIGGVTTAGVQEAVGATTQFCERNDDPWIGLAQIGNDGAPRVDIAATTAASAAADAANAPCQSRGCCMTNPESFVCAMQRNWCAGRLLSCSHRFLSKASAATSFDDVAKAAKRLAWAAWHFAASLQSFGKFCFEVGSDLRVKNQNLVLSQNQIISKILIAFNRS